MIERKGEWEWEWEFFSVHFSFESVNNYFALAIWWVIIFMNFIIRHKILSFQFGFLVMCTLWCLLRAVYFCFYGYWAFDLKLGIALYWYSLSLSWRLFNVTRQQFRIRLSQSFFHAGFLWTFNLQLFCFWWCFSCLLSTKTDGNPNIRNEPLSSLLVSISFFCFSLSVSDLKPFSQQSFSLFNVLEFLAQFFLSLLFHSFIGGCEVNGSSTSQRTTVWIELFSLDLRRGWIPIQSSISIFSN
jgi:hypothetical protein